VPVVEDPVHPVGRVHVNAYGPVPPEAEPLQVNALPDVTPLVGHDTVAVRGCAATVTGTLEVAVAESVSWAVTLTVKGPLAAKVVVKLAPVPVAGLPPVAVQVNV